MSEPNLASILLLLGTAVAVVVALMRFRIPTSLAYLLVGVLLGPHTAGPVIDAHGIRTLAEFGIVFLLFTIGLDYTLPQLRALRGQILALGSGQVVLTTALVAVLAWVAGAPVAAAFVIGAVVAQSSTTLITRQLTEQGEEHSRHGRLGTAMSVFQDVTAVPFVVLIPVLGALAGGAGGIAAPMAWAALKALLALALVLALGRLLMKPLFHEIAARRSTELFTLTVLFICLLAAWTTHSLGLSLAFGAFLAGMILGETEFRHQVEAAIRPFRDVLIGLFFVGIGMLFDPMAILPVLHYALAGAFGLLIAKTLLVAALVSASGADRQTAWRTGLVLAVGGEFGLALIAIASESAAIDRIVSQVLLASVLLSMLFAPWLIRHNGRLAQWVSARSAPLPDGRLPAPGSVTTGHLHDHVVICGFGRIGQNAGAFLEAERIPYVALDLDAGRVREAHLAGKPAYFGDGTDRGVLESVNTGKARLLLISIDDFRAASQILMLSRSLNPHIPVMVRTRDQQHTEALLAAGATEVIPEMLESGLLVASRVLRKLDVSPARIAELASNQRATHFQSLRELFPGNPHPSPLDDPAGERLHPVRLPPDSQAIGMTLADLRLPDVVVTALVRQGERTFSPDAATRLLAEDVLVLFGQPGHLLAAEHRLTHHA